MLLGQVVVGSVGWQHAETIESKIGHIVAAIGMEPFADSMAAI